MFSIGVHRRASAVEFLAGIAPVSFSDTGKRLTADARRWFVMGWQLCQTLRLLTRNHT
jgi:hypothetical protein